MLIYTVYIENIFVCMNAFTVAFQQLSFCKIKRTVKHLENIYSSSTVANLP